MRPVRAAADSVAVIGENRKMLVFKLDELPELGRGSGVQLQRYRDGGLSDAMAFALADGISWPLGGESGRVRSRERPDAMARDPRRQRAGSRPTASRGATGSSRFRLHQNRRTKVGIADRILTCIIPLETAH